MIYRRLRMLRRLLRRAQENGMVKELQASLFVEDLLRIFERFITLLYIILIGSFGYFL